MKISNLKLYLVVQIREVKHNINPKNNFRFQKKCPTEGGEHLTGECNMGDFTVYMCLIKLFKGKKLMKQQVKYGINYNNVSYFIFKFYLFAHFVTYVVHVHKYISK